MLTLRTKRKVLLACLGTIILFAGWLLYLTFIHTHSPQAVMSPDGIYVADVQFVRNKADIDGNGWYRVTVTSTRFWDAHSALVVAVPTIGAPCVGFESMRWVNGRTLKVMTDLGPTEGPTSWRDVRVVVEGDSCHLP